MSGWSAAGLDRELVPLLNEKFMDGQHDSSRHEKEKYRVHEIYQPDSTRTVPVEINRCSKADELRRTCSVSEVPPRRPHEFPILEDIQASSTSSTVRPLDGTTELPFMTVVHVMINSSSKNHQNVSPNLRSSGPSVMDFGSDQKLETNIANKASNAEEVTEAFGVTCKWKMSPRAINR